jgi:gamma-glutamylcyclotransferase (GGCT)/AIG2-like uncharacterized protein YtfP
MPRIFLFAYGTLLDKEVRRRVFGREVETRPAVLAGWCVAPRSVRGRYPGIVRATGSKSAGALLILRPRELANADAYEDAPRLYRRVRIAALVGRYARRCWIYVPAGGHGLACGPQRRLAGRP